MVTPDPNASAVLCAEILADAQREAEAITQRAQAEAKALVARVVAEAERVRGERLGQARVEAARRKRLMLATGGVEIARLRAARVEAVLEAVHAEIRRRLRERVGFDYRETVIALVVEAVQRMPGHAFVVKLSAADLATFGASLAAELPRRVGRQPVQINLVADSTKTEGGLLIEATDGCCVWNNGLLPRLERLWPELRRQIARQASLDKPGGGA